MATIVDFEAGSGWNRNGARAARDAFVNMARRFESDILLVANGRLLLDGFNADGVPPELSDNAFYGACHLRWNNDGVLAANLQGEDPRLGDNLARIRETFGSSVALAAAKDSAGNIIAFAWKNGVPLPPLEALMEQADQQAGQPGVDFVETAVRNEMGASHDWTRQGASKSV